MIPYDNVHIRPFPSDEIRLKSGHILYLDTRFEEYLNAQTAGEVLDVPERLRFSRDFSRMSLDYDTDMELKVGDVVIYNYLSVSNARKLGHVMDGGGVLIPYDKIYVAIRDGKVIPINGVILVEPEQEKIRTFLHTPEQAKLNSKQIGRVMYAGSPNRGYRQFPDIPNDEPVSVGDRILFNWTDAIPIQPNHELRGEVTKEKMLYRMQHKDAIALVPEGVDLDA